MINKLKRQIIQMSFESGEGHIASAFSILDIIWVLYDRVLNVNPDNPDDPDRDRFILSKGHGCLAHYVVLAEKGFFPIENLPTFAQYNSMLGGHPDRTIVPGVEASTGSLGHGAVISVGIAMALKIRGKSSRVYCLIGDGELNEGSVWEAAMLATHHKLSNLCWIVDYNHSTDRALQVNPLMSKFDAFGWISLSGNGHTHSHLYNAFALDFRVVGGNNPVVFIANTVKGNGVSFMENNPEWHHKAPNQDEYDRIIRELL